MSTTTRTADPPMDRADLDEIVQAVGDAWSGLQGGQLLLTGGTGIIGRWLLSSLLHANRTRSLGVRVHVLSRDPGRFGAACPTLAHDPAVSLLAGDVRRFDVDRGVRFTHVVHGATDVVAQASATETVETCVGGTSRTLEIARRCGATRFLLLSSGAIYGKAPPDLERIPEDFSGAIDPMNPASAYAEGKRCAELLCASATAEGGPAAVAARCFAMVGPYLPLDKHFAIGNFIGDALHGRDIHINGDGSPVRSYLHAVDVTSWLWVLLLRGTPGRAYNVGSSEPVSILELAQRVMAALGVASRIELARAPQPQAHANVYVPSNRRVSDELGLRQTVSLEDAVRRTAAWWRHTMVQDSPR